MISCVSNPISVYSVCLYVFSGNAHANITVYYMYFADHGSIVNAR